MGFFLSPIKFLVELICFLISAAFVYGLALIAAVTFIVYAVNESKKSIEYVHTTETVVETVEVEVSKTPELTCERIAGCEIFPNAVTEKEYCPTCIVK